jgi:integrase
MPKYLPRPLPTAADRALQERLANACCFLADGLLLMRKTGLRIGELRNLEVDCIREDHLGNKFLKVPLGKLHTERLVPHDDSAVALIEKIRDSGRDTPKRRSLLLTTEDGQKTSYEDYSKLLGLLSEGLETNGKMVSHRLRHTYATTMLNAGMSLIAVMKLLGHSDHRMTLRYAEITMETTSKEYFNALVKIEHRYDSVLHNANTNELSNDPAKLLREALKQLQKLEHCAPKLKNSFIRRLRRLQHDIERLPPTFEDSPT